MPRAGLSVQVLERTNRVRQKIESIITLSDGIMVVFLDDIGRDLSEIEALCKRKTQVQVVYATAAGVTSDAFLADEGQLDVVKIPRSRKPAAKGKSS